MLKRVLFFAVITSCSTLSYAADKAGNYDSTLQIFKPNKVLTQPKSANKYFDRQYYQPKSIYEFYVGATGGINSITFKRSLSSSILNNTSRPNATGLDGGAFIGFGATINKFYIGGETYGSVFNIIHKENAMTADGEYSFNKMGGIDLLLGFCPTKSTKVYGRAGMAVSRFHAKTNTPATHPGLPTTAAKKYAVGYHLGVGIDLYLTKYFSIRPEYDFVKFRNIWVNVTSGGVTYKNKFSPYINRFALALVLHIK